MWFVRSLSDALKFRPWLRFWSLVCISSGCGRFVALWGLWSFVRWFFGFPVVLALFRSLAAFPPCLVSYFVRYGLLFCFVGSSSPVVLFSFCGLFTASDFWQRFRFWAWLWCRFLGMVCPSFFRFPFGILCGFFCFHGSIFPAAGGGPAVVLRVGFNMSL